MGVKTTEIGGGAAKGLSNDVVTMLQSLLAPGGTGVAGGPNPYHSTTGTYGVLSDVLSAGGGNLGGALAQLLSKQQDRDVNGLRARFGASGGQAFGTPAAYAESNYRAQAAPQIATQVGQLQLSALAPLLSGAFNLSQLGIPQAQVVQQRTGFGDFLGTIAPIASAALPFLGNPFGGGGGGGIVPAPNVPAFNPNSLNGLTLPQVTL